LFPLKDIETSWLKNFQYVEMKNVIENVSFECILPNLNFNYVFRQGGFILIPINRIHRINGELVIETKEEHRLLPGFVINNIENVDSNSQFASSNIPIIDIMSLNEVEIGIETARTFGMTLKIVGEVIYTEATPSV
jgi:hypothetical protein